MPDSELIELDLADGSVVLVRAERLDPSEDDGPSDIGFRDFSFSSVSSTLRSVASEIRDAVRAAEPDEVQVELGFELAVKGSKLVCLLADGEGKTSLKVTMKWAKDAARPA